MQYDDAFQSGAPGWSPLNLVPQPAGAPLPCSRHQAETWRLVLTARRIPCRQEQVAGGYLVLVPGVMLPAAREQIRLFEQENRNWPPPMPRTEPLLENQLATLAVFLLLCGFSTISVMDRPWAGGPTIDWFQLGSAVAGLIVQGEWWRAATALTLHSGGLHLAGNVLFGIICVGRLARDLGSGLAWLLVLLSGIGGNLLNALLQSPQHNAVGASTAVFGAIGILAGLNLIRYRIILWRRWALPLAGAFALLAMLGASGERTDLGAHLFGLLVGVGGGALTALVLTRVGRPGRWGNRAYAIIALAIIVSAWWLALTHA